MKIIYIANSRIPTTKAHGFQIIKMCETFSNLGVKVDLLIPRRFNQIKDSPFEYYGIREIFNIQKVPVIDLMPFVKILGPIANLVGSLTFAIFVLYHLYRSGSENQQVSASTIIYSRDQFTLWFLSFFNKKFVYEVHSFPRRAALYRRIWKKAHKIIVITSALKNLVVKAGTSEEKIMIAPDAVDTADFEAIPQTVDELKIELGLPKDEFLVGYVGRFKTLGMEKGIKTMIEALPMLSKDIKMAFIGGEELEIKEYKNLANRFNVSAQCVFIGYQPRLRAIKYIKAMDTLVIPFPNVPHYAFYASPLKLFEYMASGRPIIASDLPALREVLNDQNALFFKPEDTDDLARAVKTLKSSQMLGYHLSQQALADVKQYTWTKRAEKILKFIEINK